MQKQMAQVQAMQRQMEEMQAELEAKEYQTTAGGGAVSVKVNGKREILEMTLSPEIVDPDDIEMLQDLVVAAVNEAMRQVDEDSNSEMSKLTGGLGIPGL
ncbi:MAG: YbaB/EbfC family nucleoid-associated protein [Clostridiales bacterium]|nr:YbaB/EbfC family nucleoid-associated protein [Clostridiales bacterium]MDD7347188.1 YbaB/EbfC family nucleoid-associated protein [Clostridiales bacterium]MDY4060968.1 YbaB/EbfC family nucleoid-associated protein [Anaerovoracaceae bacterium]